VNVPQAEYEGTFTIGAIPISAAVLPNGKRLLTQATFLRALGRARSPKVGTGVLSTVDGIPFFLQAESLKPFISEKLRESTTPIFFREKSGKRAVGYDAELLPMVAEVYLKFRDDCLEKHGKVPSNYRHIIQACDILIRGLAHIGVIALVDEATGYQEVRDKDALNKILSAYISEELLPWAQRFPSSFYKEIFRLKGWTYSPLNPMKGPRLVGKLTNQIVYEKLPPGILDELRRKNPVISNKRRKYKHHQFLTEDIGNPHLEKHIASVTTLMRISPHWKTFERHLEKAFPTPNKPMQIEMVLDKEEDVWVETKALGEE
jgi:P63C domain